MFDCRLLGYEENSLEIDNYLLVQGFFSFPFQDKVPPYLPFHYVSTVFSDSIY